MVLRGIGAAVTGAALSGTATGQQSEAGNWRAYGYDENNTGYNPYTDDITVEIERKWRFNAQSAITSAPIVIGDTIYTTGTDNRVYAVTNTGNTQIYTLGGTSSSSNNSLPEPVTSLASTPTVADGTLYVGGLDGSVYSIDTDSQSQRWSFRTDGPVRSSPAIANKTVYIGSTDSTVVAIDIVDGSEQWRFETDGPVVTSPAIVNETVLAGSDDGRLYALDSSSGSEQWRYDTGSSVYASPVVTDSRVYTVNSGGEVIALSTADGSELWTESVGSEVTATPTLVNESLCVGTHDGAIVMIDGQSGSSTWRVSTGGEIRGGLAASTNTVYVGTADGRLQALDMADGESLWSFDIDSGISGAVTVADGRLYVGTQNGLVFAFGEPSGLEQLSATALQTATETIETYGEEAAGVFGGGVAVVGGYVGTKRLRSRLNSDDSADDSTSLSYGDPSPIVSDGPDISQSQFPDLSNVDYDDFEMGRLIGSGGNADVHEATVTRNDHEQTIALKSPRMSDYETVDVDFFEEFVEEARVWDNIDDHDNIVTVLGWGERPHPWIGLEYMDGGNLDELMGNLSTDQIFTHLEEMSEAIHHAHRQGITHTDLKPENVLFTTHDGRRVAKITDWGLATVLLEHSTSVQGLTPAYSAPEQIDPQSYGGTDDRTDIYQLGAVAYELFTGELPFDRSNYSATMNAVLNDSPEPPSEVNSSLSSSLDDVILQAIAKEKDERYETVLHFRDALRRVYHSS